MQATNTLTLDEINYYFYEEDSKLYWKIRQSNRMKIGDIAGTCNFGYWQIKLKGKLYKTHRLLYQIYNNIETLDNNIEVDHIDRNTLNNSKDNLREASHRNNSCNKSITTRNTTGYKNIVIVKDYNKYFYIQVTIKYSGKQYRWKFPNTEEGLKLAIECRNNKIKEIHGKFAN